MNTTFSIHVVVPEVFYSTMKPYWNQCKISRWNRMQNVPGDFSEQDSSTRVYLTGMNIVHYQEYCGFHDTTYTYLLKTRLNKWKWHEHRVSWRVFLWLRIKYLKGLWANVHSGRIVLAVQNITTMASSTASSYLIFPTKTLNRI